MWNKVKLRELPSRQDISDGCHFYLDVSGELSCISSGVEAYALTKDNKIKVEVLSFPSSKEISFGKTKIPEQKRVVYEDLLNPLIGKKFNIYLSFVTPMETNKQNPYLAYVLDQCELEGYEMIRNDHDVIFGYRICFSHDKIKKVKGE